MAEPSEAGRFAERLMFGARCWIRMAIRLRVQAEISYVFQDIDTCGKCRDNASAESPTDSGRDSAAIG